MMHPIIKGAVCCLLLIAVTACGTSGKKETRDYKSTTARPEPIKIKTKTVQPKWIEPAEAVERASLKLDRGTTAHLAVTADTFEGAGIVPELQEKLVVALQESGVFGAINSGGTEGQIALDIVLVDTRDKEILFGALKGRSRLKVRITVTDTRTKQKLSPGDPANLFYGNVKEVSEKIAEYIAG